MGYTDNCDIFGSIHEDALNNIITNVMKQRPSLFNYATAEIAANSGLLCNVINCHPVVTLRHNPIVTIVDPLPIPGTNYGVGFAVQVVYIKLEFHPAKDISLPPELGTQLHEQRFALNMKICCGFACPSKEITDNLIPVPDTPKKIREEKYVNNTNQPKPPRITIPTKSLMCFCLEVYVTGGFKNVNYNGQDYLEPFLDGIEIVDIEPVELENDIECYIGLMLKLVILPGLRIALKDSVFNLTQGAPDLFPTPVNVAIGPMPVSLSLPNNPAIEDDKIKIFIRGEVV